MLVRVWRWRWSGAPRGVRLLAAAGVAVFAYGGIVHVVQLATGGWPPYRWAPAWLAGYFASLTLLDPLAAGLLWRRRAAGVYLGTIILVTDAAANGYATYALPGATVTARAAQAVISLLAVAALAALAPARRWTRAVRPPRGRWP